MKSVRISHEKKISFPAHGYATSNMPNTTEFSPKALPVHLHSRCPRTQFEDTHTLHFYTTFQKLKHQSLHAPGTRLTRSYDRFILAPSLLPPADDAERGGPLRPESLVSLALPLGVPCDDETDEEGRREGYLSSLAAAVTERFLASLAVGFP